MPYLATRDLRLMGLPHIKRGDVLSDEWLQHSSEVRRCVEANWLIAVSSEPTSVPPNSSHSARIQARRAAEVEQQRAVEQLKQLAEFNADYEKVKVDLVSALKIPQEPIVWDSVPKAAKEEDEPNFWDHLDSV